VRIMDGDVVSEPITQSTGLAQGDNISPILLVVLLASLLEKLTTEFPSLGITDYADDIALLSECIDLLRRATDRFVSLCDEVKLVITVSKTKLMKFRKAGRTARGDKLSIKGVQVELVNSFQYLGVTLTPSLASFNHHIQDRAAKATARGFMVEEPYKLSLQCALNIYDTYIEPVMSYGADIAWDSLPSSQIKVFDTVKASFMKRVLGLPLKTRNREVFIMCGCLTGAESVKKRLKLNDTENYEKYTEELYMKSTEIDLVFYQTRVFSSDTWKAPMQEERHVLTRLAAHGYHHLICINQRFHRAGSDCTCKLCGLACGQYHVMSCSENTLSMREYASLRAESP
jgi:hypothetical protein